jgi:glutamyl-tRNA synthetase
MRAAGVPPEKIVGLLAAASGLLERPEPMRASELVPLFRLDRIPKEPVTVTEAMLRELNA